MMGAARGGRTLGRGVRRTAWLLRPMAQAAGRAVLGSDAAADVLPSGVPEVDQPIHQLCLIAMGTLILDNCDLEAISLEAKQRERWEFLLVITPLAVKGGTGSPLNPIATF